MGRFGSIFVPHDRQKSAKSGRSNSPAHTKISRRACVYDTQGIHPVGTQMHAMHLDIVKSSLFLTVQAWECAGNVKPVSAFKWKSVKS